MVGCQDRRVRKLQAEREALQKSRQSDANKTRAITVTNNKTVTVRKTTAVMVANLIKETATIADSTTKGKNHKVKEIVAMIAVSNKTSSPSKLAHVLTLKPVQQP